MVLPSKRISRNTSGIMQKVTARSRSMRDTKNNGMDTETQTLIYLRRYAYVTDLGSGEHE